MKIGGNKASQRPMSKGAGVANINNSDAGSMRAKSVYQKPDDKASLSNVRINAAKEQDVRSISPSRRGGRTSANAAKSFKSTSSRGAVTAKIATRKTNNDIMQEGGSMSGALEESKENIVDYSESNDQPVVTEEEDDTA
jgi:hypothetical protein